jgi:hypothetical protein
LSGRAVSVKAWPERANSSLALVSPALGGFKDLDEFEFHEELRAHLVLLEGVPGEVRPVAVAAFVPEVETDPAVWIFRQPEYEFDLAPYEIRKGEFAFGVRLSYTTEVLSAENTSERLYLFRQEGDRLVAILSVTVGVRYEHRGRGELRNSNSVVIVASETTQGFRDIVVRTRSALGPILDDNDAVPRMSSTSTERWRWAGSHYERSP